MSEEKKIKMKYTIELLDGSKVYTNKWSSKVGGIWPAMTSTMMTEVTDALFERKGKTPKEYEKMYIPMSSILIAYEPM